MTETDLPQSNLMEWLRWLLRQRKLMKVTGRSMIPALQPGDLLFIRPLPAQGWVVENMIVVAIHPQQSSLKVIKRVSAILANGRYFLLSDNPAEGTDSRTWGALPRTSLVGVATSYAFRERRSKS